MDFPVLLTPQAGGFLVTFRDVPEALTQGASVTEALEEAKDALHTALEFYWEDRRRMPVPSAAEVGEHLVTLPASVAAKVFLLDALVETETTPAELARKLLVRPQEVTRILDLHHVTKIDTLQDALDAVHRRLQLSVVTAARVDVL